MTALCRFALLLLFTANAFAEFRSAIAVRIVTPDPLLPVSGGVGPSHPTTVRDGDSVFARPRSDQASTTSATNFCNCRKLRHS